MKVYKLINLKNNKIYIGSTSKSLEERFGGHVHDSKYRNTKLYKDMKKYDKSDYAMVLLFEDTTITRKQLYEIEDKIIKEYYEIYGEDLMLNDSNSAWKIKNYSHLHSSESQRKTVATIIKNRKKQFGENYNDMLTPEQRKRAGKNSGESRKAILQFNNEEKIRGIQEFVVYLNEKGYDITRKHINSYLYGGHFPKKVLEKYPDLINIKFLTLKERLNNITWEEKYNEN